MSSLYETPMLKYPSTAHLEGSALQKGDGYSRVSVGSLTGRGDVVYEEKIDGANAGFRFDGAGELLAQCRGHYIDANDRNADGERDWKLFKDWLAVHRDAFLERFEDRYVVYGEMMGIVHSIFYDRLPTLFLEFDIYDTAKGRFLDTQSRRELTKGLPISSVPVLRGAGPALRYGEMVDLVGFSVFQTPGVGGEASWPGHVSPRETWQANLRRACAVVGDDYDRRLPKLDLSGLAEGLYVKLERDGAVIERFKWVREGFTQVILASNEHWQSRFPVPNFLDSPVDGYPVHLARVPVPGSSPYNADEPWIWGPWTPAAPGAAAPNRRL